MRRLAFAFPAPRRLVWGLAAAAAMTTAAVAFALFAGSAPDGARAAGVGPDLSIEVAGVPGCTTDQEPPAASCAAPAGTFTVRVRPNSIAGLSDRDNDAKAGYLAVEALLAFSPGLSFRAFRALGVWPDCAVPLLNDLTPGEVLVGCGTGVGQNESLYLGPVFEVDFDCPSAPGSEQVTMRHGSPIGSHVIDGAFTEILDKDPDEVLTIDCTQPPPPPPPPSPGAMAVDCDGSPSLFAVGVQDDCVYAVGETFLVQIHVTEPPTNGFLGFNTRIHWSDPPLEYLPAANFADEALWQHCSAPDRAPLPSPPIYEVNFGCGPQPLPVGDTSTSALLAYLFRCDAEGAASIFFDGTPALNAFIVTTGGSNKPQVSPATVRCVSLPHNLKLPPLQNLFLTAQGEKLGPDTCAESTDVAEFSYELSNLPRTPDPQDTGEFQVLGAFSLSVHFDPKLVCVNVEPGQRALDTGMVCLIDDKDDGVQPQRQSRIGCLTKKSPDPPASDSLELARILVRPQPEAYKLLRAHKSNGMIVHLANQGCNLVDMKGQPIPSVGCPDANLTIRWLEGDIDGTCGVDVQDQQIVAFRWGVKLGHLLYSQRFDLEPSGVVNSDGDVDIKDVQFVFGRHSSTCDDPNPPQPPKNPNVSDPAP